MAKVNIDLEKLICAMMKRYYFIHSIDRSTVKCWLDNVLEDCGIEYKDGSLHYIGEEEPDFQDIVDEYVKAREKTIYPATMSEQLAFYTGLVVMWNKMRRENEL